MANLTNSSARRIDVETELYCYLENRRKKELPATDEFERWLDPDKTAVVSIDMHRGHIGPEPEVTCPAPRARAKIPAHNMFHQLCRDIDIPIIHVQHWQRHGGIDGINSKKWNRRENWRSIYELYLPPNPLMDQHSWEGTKWLDLLVENDPECDYYVRTKKRLSSFYPTDLEFLLRQLDIHNIVITGTYTDACDLSTAFDAANRDFRVTVPRDIVAGYSEEAENAALLIISLVLGLVVDSPALLREWYARKGKELPTILDGVTDISTVAGEVPLGV
jgi:nicotinamidase-related amidase